MLIRSRIPGFVLVLLCAFLLVRPGLADEAAAKATVDRLHEALGNVMRNASTLGFTGRYDRLAPVVEESFDLAFIASVVTGRHWDSLDGAQRERMIDTFTRLTIATYAARFDDFSGEAFEVAGVKRMKSDRMLVRTELREGDGEVIQLDYLLHDAGGEWKIVNVIADGVSDLSIKRAEYSSVIADSGFDALISRLNEQIEDYADS